MNRILGYVVSLLGIGVLTLGIKPTNAYFDDVLPFISSINDLYFMIGGFVILVIGVFLIRASGSSRDRKGKNVDLPIYQGKDVVGYRRG